MNRSMHKRSGRRAVTEAPELPKADLTDPTLEGKNVIITHKKNPNYIYNGKQEHENPTQHEHKRWYQWSNWSDDKYAGHDGGFRGIMKLVGELKHSFDGFLFCGSLGEIDVQNYSLKLPIKLDDGKSYDFACSDDRTAFAKSVSEMIG